MAEMDQLVKANVLMQTFDHVFIMDIMITSVLEVLALILSTKLLTQVNEVILVTSILFSCSLFGDKLGTKPLSGVVAAYYFSSVKRDLFYQKGFLLDTALT